MALVNGLKVTSAICRAEGPGILVIDSADEKAKIRTMPSSLSMIPQQAPVIEDAPPLQIDEIARAFVKLFTSVGSLVLEWTWCELIVQAGWLPHASVPPELIADAKNVEDAGLRLGSGPIDVRGAI
jgi:hypothetical protein